MQGRFNSIQKSMLQWNELHPYNVVHVVQIGEVLEVARLQDCVNETLGRHGLTCLRVNKQRFAFEYGGGPSECEVQILACLAEPLNTLTLEIERQLNLEFPCNQPFCPFRFFVLPGEHGFFLGVAYFHAVADAESMVRLLKDIVMIYAQHAPWHPGGPFDLYPVNRSNRLLAHQMVLARKLLSLPAQVRNMRQSNRPRHRDLEDMNNGFVCFSLGTEELSSLVATAKVWAVTLNDLFLGLLMKALSPCAVGREQERRRRKISIGCIVNLRKDLDLDTPRVFGVFLGSFTVTHAIPTGMSLREVCTDIRQQTSRIKRRKLYLGTPLELGLARLFFRCFSPARRKIFYPKHYPLWGGITNMNLNSIWNETDHTVALDYFRGVSTGPVTPLALSVTTVGSRVNFGVSYRTAVFLKEDIEKLERRFWEQIEQTREAV